MQLLANAKLHALTAHPDTSVALYYLLHHHYYCVCVCVSVSEVDTTASGHLGPEL